MKFLTEHLSDSRPLMPAHQVFEFSLKFLPKS